MSRVHAPPEVTTAIAVNGEQQDSFVQAETASYDVSATATTTDGTFESSGSQGIGESSWSEIGNLLGMDFETLELRVRASATAYQDSVFSTELSAGGNSWSWGSGWQTHTLTNQPASSIEMKAASETGNGCKAHWEITMVPAVGSSVTVTGVSQS